MKFIFGLIIVVLTFNFIDPIVRVTFSYGYLVLAILIVSIGFLVGNRFYHYQFRNSDIVLKVVRYILKIFLLMMIVASFIIYVNFIRDTNSLNMPDPIIKNLKITIQNKEPCFYIDKFDGIEAFDIKEISVAKMKKNPSIGYDFNATYETYWCVGLCEDIPRKINLPLSSFAGINQCLPYGTQHEKSSILSKKMEMNTLYIATVSGEKRNIIPEKFTDADKIIASSLFYLHKNSKTGQIEVLELNRDQINTWFSKQKSIQ